jgi:hypothetical protein
MGYAYGWHTYPKILRFPLREEIYKCKRMSSEWRKLGGKWYQPVIYYYPYRRFTEERTKARGCHYLLSLLMPKRLDAYIMQERQQMAQAHSSRSTAVTLEVVASMWIFLLH